MILAVYFASGKSRTMILLDEISDANVAAMIATIRKAKSPIRTTSLMLALRRDIICNQYVVKESI